MKDSSERRTKETDLLKYYWQSWNQLLQSRGVYEDPDTPKNYSFTIDRRDEAESLFTADSIDAMTISIPIEEWYGVKTLGWQTQRREKWLKIAIKPRQPYRPRLALLTQHGYKFYYTEGLSICLSSLGRAFEETSWVEVLKPAYHRIRPPWISYLKRAPLTEEITDQLVEEPYEKTGGIEYFQPLKGSNLERLDFLMMKIKKGDIIER